MYKDIFTADQLGQETITATQELLTTMWSPTKSERLAGCHLWLDRVCAVNQISVPEFNFIEGNEGNILYKETGGGQVFADPTTGTKKMFMYKRFSITTFLHEFRHIMQYSGLVSIPGARPAATLAVPTMPTPLIPMDPDNLFSGFNNAAPIDSACVNQQTTISGPETVFGEVPPVAPFDPEEDARSWSCSLYYQSDSDRYMRAVTKGILRYC